MITAGRSFYRLFRVAESQTEGKLLYQLGNGQWNIPELRELLEVILAQESSFDDFEVTHDFPEIGTRSMLLNARKIWCEGNNSHRILLAIEDITERRQAELERLRTGEIYRRLLASSSDSIKLLALNGTVLSMNENASKVLGRGGAQSFLGASWVDLWPGEAHPVAERCLAEVQQGNSTDFESFRPSPDGEIRWWHVVLSPVLDIAQKPEFILVVSRDVTERRQSQDLLRAANKELESVSRELRRSNEDLEQFARVAGHDLRAPLTTIVSFAQLLERRYLPVLSGGGEQYLKQIVDGGKRMAQLIEDLMRYAAFAQEPLAPPGPVSAQEACLVAREALKSAIEMSAAEVHCHIAEEVTVSLEMSRLVQVLQNLIGNAITYRVERRTPVIQISAEPRGIEWQFSVSDNGPGIDQRYLQSIFEPFKRLHGPEKPGSGIGLATCKRIIERADGSIWADSKPGAGATFYFLLPRSI